MNKEKGTISVVISVICCLFSAVCLYKMISLERQIENMNSYINNRISSLQTDVSSAASRVEQKLTDEASLLVSTDYELGRMDEKDRTVLLTYTAVPKEFEPEKTKAVLVCSGAVYDMKLADGAYTAEFPIALAEETKICSVQLCEDGRVRTQAVDTYVNPRYEYLGTVYSDFSGRWSVRKEEGVTELSFDGDVNVNLERGRMGGKVRSIAIANYVDGTKISSMEIPLEESRPGENGGQAEVRALPVEAGEESWNYYYYHLNENYDVPFGSTFGLKTIVTMENGLAYENWIERESFDEAGELVEGNSLEDMTWNGAEASIYDAGGNLIFDGLDKR